MYSELDLEKVTEYQNNGVIHISQAIDQDWVDRMLQVVDRQLENPSKWANDNRQEVAQGRMFTDRYQWKTNPEIHAFVHQSPLAKIAAQAMQSQTARFYFDHLLIKEPATEAVTPWHQDIPYWPFKGKQICSIWVALTETTVSESSLEFVAGSHLDGNYYHPEAFNKSAGNVNASWQQQGKGLPVPPIEDERDKHNIVGWDVKPGDALLFSAWVLHGAPGNSSSSRRRAAISTRWLGDDVTWFPHPGSDPTIQEADVCVQPGQAPEDESVFPCIWPAVK